RAVVDVDPAQHLAGKVGLERNRARLAVDDADLGDLAQCVVAVGRGPVGAGGVDVLVVGRDRHAGVVGQGIAVGGREIGLGRAVADLAPARVRDDASALVDAGRSVDIVGDTRNAP